MYVQHFNLNSTLKKFRVELHNSAEKSTTCMYQPIPRQGCARTMTWIFPTRSKSVTLFFFKQYNKTSMALNSNIPPINLDESLTHQYMLYDPNTRRSAISETTRYSGTGTFVVADNIPYREAINTLREPQTYTPVWFGNADYTGADVSSIVLGNREGGAVTTGLNSVSINPNGGPMNQSDGTVAIGLNADQYNQNASAIALGSSAGNTGQGTNSVAIGAAAGQNAQSERSVAIGHNAGATSQGADSVAIGANAGTNSQAANSIVVNASGAALENTGVVPSSCVIKPIRNVADQTALASLQYNPSTSEVSWSTPSPRVYINGTIDAQTLVLPGIPVIDSNHPLTFTPRYSSGLVAISSSQITLNPNKNYRMVFQLEIDYFFPGSNNFSLYANLDGVPLLAPHPRL